MRCAIKDGALQPPKTLARAVDRRRRLAGEIARIEVQLQAETDRDLEWRESAEHALARHRLEFDLLGKWIDRRLLGDLRDMLIELRADHFEFEEEEEELIDHLAEHLSTPEPTTRRPRRHPCL